MQQPKVSVIVPCWGVEKYLDKCVESIVNQTLRDIEIILVDDVSPDRVPEMCDAWAQKDSRIKVIHKTKNEGLGMACNTGIDAATGEYIAFCDSDDWVDSDMYETMYDAAKKYNAQMVFTGLKRVDAAGNALESLPHRKKLEVYKTATDIEEFALDMIASAPTIREDRTIQVSSKVVLYSSTIIKQHKLTFVSEREIPSEDLIFNIHFLNHTQCICTIPYKFYNYRVNTQSISRKPDFNRFLSCKKLYFYLQKECRELEFRDEYITRNQRMLLGQARSCVKFCQEWNISRREKLNFINSICFDRIWTEIYNSYPIHQMPLPHKVFTYAMKLKLPVILSLLMR